MIHTLKPYSAYKDSCVSWLGKVPEHWEVRRLKQLCTRSAIYGANVPAEQYSNTGTRFIRTTDITESGELKKSGVFLPTELVKDYLLENGDLLLSRSGTIGRSFLFDENRHGQCAYAGYLVRFVPNKKVVPKYIFRFTQTTAFDGFLKAIAISSTIENVNGEKYASCLLPLPPLPEQTAIVRFLDYMDRRIKRYINAKQNMIKLLSEYKQALIHQAVTGKIDFRTGKPYPSYKDSGVEWLGKVPEHWEVRRLKRIAHINPNKSEVPLTLRNGNAVFLPMERVGTNGHFDASDVRPILSLWNGFTYFRRGDIIVAKITPCFENGKGACLENLPTAIGFGSTEFHVIRPSKAIVTAYLYRLTTLSDFRRLGTDEMTGAAGQQRVPAEFIANFWVPLPPLPEQTAIVEYLDDQTGKIDTAIASTRKEIELLREYRERLIADVVTGKVDVRGMAERLPEEAEEDIIDDGAEQAVFEEDETTSEAENELKEETSTEDEL